MAGPALDFLVRTSQRERALFFMIKHKHCPPCRGVAPRARGDAVGSELIRMGILMTRLALVRCTLELSNRICRRWFMTRRA